MTSRKLKSKFDSIPAKTTPQTILAWLEKKAGDAIVGRAEINNSCLVAMFLREEVGIATSVCQSSQYHANIHIVSGNNSMIGPMWLNRVAQEFDIAGGCRGSSVTAHQVLSNPQIMVYLNVEAAPAVENNPTPTPSTPPVIPALDPDPVEEPVEPELVGAY